ncbi:MAG: vitamin B12-dependent ribonucleotide reductase [Polyangiaceae bacterium]
MVAAAELLPARPVRLGRWTEQARRILAERYLTRHDGALETPEDMCWRVARAVAAAERAWGMTDEGVAELAGRFYDLMVRGLFLPNSPTLMNAGKGSKLQYSACYVLPIGDSMEEIFDAVKAAAVVHQSGGGTGFSFSRLRPRDSLVASTGGRSSGPVSFLRVFDGATEAVKQGGTRRGANMGVLRVDHPDVLEFVECKLDGSITNFNISVAVSDAFMGALERGESYALVAPHTGETVSRLDARQVFARIARAAWQSGDPGLIFIDRINAGRANPTPALGLIEATNPCGEQPLLPNEACNLGSIDVAKLARREGDGWGIDWDELARVTREAARFLDDVIEVNPYPLPAIDRVVKQNRRIGVGVMGFADLLFRLGVPYDSEAALVIAERVMEAIQRDGHQESQRMAAQRGAFPSWASSIYGQGEPLRNATVTTIAPTGTLSILAGCSSGIEPVFALSFTHRVGDRVLPFVNPVFEQVARERGFWSGELGDDVARRGSVQGLAAVPADVQRVFVTAHEVALEWHVLHQAAFQRWTDNGVSKTINLPHEATVDDVARAYMLAWELGCLGITVFRDGSKPGVLSVGSAPAVPAPPAGASAAAEGGAASLLERPAADAPARSSRVLEPRPPSLSGTTYRVETPLGTAYVVVNEDAGGAPFEVFVSVGKAGTDTSAVAEAIGRLVSLALRVPSPVSGRARLGEIVEQLSGIGGARPLGFGSERVLSLPDGVARALARHLGSEPTRSGGDICPDCGAGALAREEGCTKCHACGFSEC